MKKKNILNKKFDHTNNLTNNITNENINIAKNTLVKNQILKFRKELA